MTSPSEVEFFAPVPVFEHAEPAPPPALPEPREAGESGLSVATALGITGAALVLSLLLSVVAPQLLSEGDSADTSLRKLVVLTLGFYVLGGLALGAFVVQRGVRLVWHRRGVVDALVLGLPLGLAGGGLGVAISSASAGHLQSDPNVTALVGGGGALRIGLVLVTTAVLAPVVEEVLFRGVTAGTLLQRGLAPAVWVSAGAFSVWHVNPVALRYYVVMGLVFAGLWRSRGLIASMSAHAAFNGVLTLAAVAATGSPATPTAFGELVVAVPSGWHVSGGYASAGSLTYDGPSGEGLALLRLPAAGASLDDVAQGAADAGAEGLALAPGSIERRQTSAGEAVLADVDVLGQPGHVLITLVGDEAYEIVMVTGGSPAAERAWDELVDRLRVRS